MIRKFYLEHMPGPDAVWGDKHPQYADPKAEPGALSTISELFPDAVYIQIYRNPRAVVHSIMSKGWLSFTDAVEKYKQIFITGREFGESLETGRYLEIKYENLVNHGVDVMSQVCKFLGIPNSKELINFMELQEMERTPVAEPVSRVEKIG